MNACWEAPQHSCNPKNTQRYQPAVCSCAPAEDVHEMNSRTRTASWQKRLCWRGREFESVLRSRGIQMLVFSSEHPVCTVKE